MVSNAGGAWSPRLPPTTQPTRQSQVRLSSLQPWATIWPNTAYYQVLLGSLNYVVLAYV